MAHSNLDKENFDKFVSDYAQKAGMDEQEFDKDAYYDSSLTYQENKENFKASFPLPSNRDSTAREIRGEKVQEYKYNAEMRAAENKAAKESRREMAQQDITASALTSSTIQDAEQEYSQEEASRKKGLLESASEFIDEKKRGLKEYQEKKQKEREYRATSKYKDYSNRSQLEKIEGYNKAYEKQHNPLLNIAQGLGNARETVRGVRGAVAGGNRSMLFQAANARSPLLSLAGGQQQKKRGKYVTIIQNGIARRVRVPDEGDAMMQGPQGPQVGSGLMGMLMHGSSKSSGGLLSLSLSEKRNGRAGPQRTGIAAAVFGGGAHKPGLSILGGGGRKSPLMSARTGGGKLRLHSGKSRLRL